MNEQKKSPMFITYIVEDGKVVPENDTLKWCQFMEFPENRQLAYDIMFDGTRFSTIFLGLDHSFDFSDRDNHKPVLWETMQFLKSGRTEQWRYTSAEEAIENHNRLVKRYRSHFNAPTRFYRYLQYKLPIWIDKLLT